MHCAFDSNSQCSHGWQVQHSVLPQTLAALPHATENLPLARSLACGESAGKDSISLSERIHLVKIDVSAVANDLPEVPRNHPCHIIVSKAYAIYRPAGLLNVWLAQHRARAVCLQHAARTSQESHFPRTVSVGLTPYQDRSYSCRRLVFWTARSRGSNAGHCETRGLRDCNTR